MKLIRYAGNPILSPHPEHPWEDLAVFNPAAWYDETKKEVLLLYGRPNQGRNTNAGLGWPGAPTGFISSGFRTSRC